MLPAIAYALVRGISEASTPDKKITWKEVDTWIAHVGNRWNHNRGYTGGRLPPAFGNGFVELRRISVGQNMFRLEAAVVFDERQGAATRKNWTGKLDAELEKMFGKNRRIRIKV